MLIRHSISTGPLALGHLILSRGHLVGILLAPTDHLIEEPVLIKKQQQQQNSAQLSVIIFVIFVIWAT